MTKLSRVTDLPVLRKLRDEAHAHGPIAYGNHQICDEDALFYATCYEMLPALLAEIERLDAEIEQLKADAVHAKERD
jgi:hypothetical protein